MSNDRSAGREPDARRPGAGPQHCVVGETVREVVVLSEALWEALEPGRRPDPAVHVPGLGWVCAMRPRR